MVLTLGIPFRKGTSAGLLLYAVYGASQVGNFLRYYSYVNDHTL